MYHLYLNVPKCKRCGSYKTGVFVKGNISYPWLIKLMLKRGTHIAFTSQNEHNCFCLNCGLDWLEDYVKWQLLNAQDYEKQKKLRQSDKALDNMSDHFAQIIEEQKNKSFKNKITKKTKDLKDFVKSLKI